MRVGSDILPAAGETSFTALFFAAVLYRLNDRSYVHKQQPINCIPVRQNIFDIEL
jgi:hypothetical protein